MNDSHGVAIVCYSISILFLYIPPRRLDMQVHVYYSSSPSPLHSCCGCGSLSASSRRVAEVFFVVYTLARSLHSSQTRLVYSYIWIMGGIDELFTYYCIQTSYLHLHLRIKLVVCNMWHVPCSMELDMSNRHVFGKCSICDWNNLFSIPHWIAIKMRTGIINYGLTDLANMLQPPWVDFQI